MLEAINLGCVRGTRRLFKGLNFSVRPGGLIEVRGPNGSGKTSLLRIISGLAAPAEGEVRWNETSIRTLGEDYRGAVAYLAHQSAVKDELSAFENLRISSAVSGCPLGESDAMAILAKVGLGNQRWLPARLLSAGQRRRVALARLLSSRASLWLLDEVTASLDDEAVNLTRHLLNDHFARGGLAIIAMHQELKVTAVSVQRLELAT